MSKSDIKILLLMPYSPVPTNSGNKTLSTNLLKYVSVYTICDLIILVDKGQNENDVKEDILNTLPLIRNIFIFNKPSLLLSLISSIKQISKGYHHSIGKYHSKSLANFLINLLSRENYDLVHIDMIHMVQYSRYCDSLPLVLVASDSYSYAAKIAKKVCRNYLRGIWLSIQSKLLLNYERKEYKSFSKVCLVSDIDREYLAVHAPNLRLQTIGIAIGSEYTEKSARCFPEKDIEKTMILCTGAISVPEIAESFISFLELCYAEILNTFPYVDFVILGRKPTKLLESRLLDFPRVQHIDYVSDYISFLNQDWVYV
jgi:hypothetical protein